MRAFYHPDQALHDPQVFMRAGVLAAPTDLPERTARLLAALVRQGITPEAGTVDGRDAALLVHARGYVDFLENAYRLWRELPDAGPEVFPNASPYWNGAADHEMRGDCPSDHIIAQTNFYLGDGAVAIGQHTARSAFASAGSAASAARAVLAGDRAAYALCRPSGHHSRGDRASGFCYLNNAAIAAQILREGFGRVAVLDVDAHHGDGTQEIFYRREDVMTVSVHVDPAQYYPWFTGYEHEVGALSGIGSNLNLPLPVGTGDPGFLQAVEKAVETIVSGGVGALVLSLGYDAHEGDPLTALGVTTQGFHRLGAVIAAAGLPTVIVQEGGYGIEVIGDCLDNFLTGFRNE